jgi:hypothetical protein
MLLLKNILGSAPCEPVETWANAGYISVDLHEGIRRRISEWCVNFTPPMKLHGRARNACGGPFALFHLVA